ncbi:MAG: DUF29 domain-containing protein [Bdellovibrionales bacterium]|nr:DUF29 domain-containing protein [Massilia sp.]
MIQSTPIDTLCRSGDAANPANYEQDFVLWIDTQLALLRAKKFDQLDLDNLIEEFDSKGRSEHRELKSRLEVLLLHLLKCQCQAGRKSRSWLSAIIEQRLAIARQIEQSPSLRQRVGPYASKVHPGAVSLAAQQTGLQNSDFPVENPYTPQQLLDPEFFP